MINAVRLESVRAHADTRIEFERFTALVGPNSTGKSTVLGVIDRACQTLRRHLVEQLQYAWDGFDRAYDPDRLVRRSAENHLAIELHLRHPNPSLLRLEAKKRGEDWLWSLRINDSAPPSNLATTLETAGFAKNSPRSALLVAALSTYSFRLEPSRIAQPFHLQNSRGAGTDGGQTGLWLLELQQQRNKAAYDAVTSAIRTIVPSLEGVRAVVETGNQASVKLLYDFADAIDVEATAVSEGTLLATAMLVALHSANGPRILLLDDIERGLHPTAQLRFVKQLKQLLDREPELQIIATTHSPYILDGLEPSQVRAFARRRDGSIAVKSLAEHPEAKATAGSLTTGQLWALDDEAHWVLPTEERAA